MPEVRVVGVACEPQREWGGQRMTPCSQLSPSSLLWIPSLHGNAFPGFAAPEVCILLSGMAAGSSLAGNVSSQTVSNTALCVSELCHYLKTTSLENSF